MASEESIGYVLTVYTGRGLPPDRSDFEDKAKAEKAFLDAKAFSILWQSRPTTQGLGWLKLKEKEAPPPAPPAAAKPAVAVAKPPAPAAPAAP
jgi:hypothetical protein